MTIALNYAKSNQSLQVKPCLNKGNISVVSDIEVMQMVMWVLGSITAYLGFSSSRYKSKT